VTSLAEDLQERLTASPFHASMGLEVVQAERGTVVLAFRALPEHLNLQGLVHGGVLATLADTAMGLAVRTSVEPGHRHVTIQLGMQYVRPASPGPIRALGRVIRTGSQIAHADAEITDDALRVLARAQGTYSVARDRTN
jgi:uncharacterized protein (TIGR00369 family)